MQTLNRSVSDVLRVKFQLGLFDSPYVLNPESANNIVGFEKNKDFVLQMAKESLVLLKNKNNFLPLNLNQTKKILVTGPMATATNYMTSRYGPTNLPTLSILKGIEQFVAKKVDVTYLKGCDLTDATWPESEIISTPLTTREKASIDSTVSIAKDVDVIIAVMGEDELIVGEALSRTSLDLPGRQNALLEALKATGKPILLILVNGQPLSINWADRNVEGILETWFGNVLVGQAVAETIFGEYNPGGKLSITFPKTTGQIEYNFPFKPASHAQQPVSGPNGYGKSSVNNALYPFGFGLSYTNFSYANLKLSSYKLDKKDSILISVDITNTGKFVGDEVVQLYLNDEISSVTTYEKVLRGFERVQLKPGETKQVKFIVPLEEMGLWNKDMKYVTETGWFKVWVASSSEDMKLQDRFEVVN